MREFLRVYRWGVHTKYHMALYYAGIVFVKILLDFFIGSYRTDNLFLFEAVLVCFCISVLEYFIFPENREFEKAALIRRSLLWFVMMNLAFIGSALLLNWFPARPLWYYVVLLCFLEFGICAMWVGLHIAEKVESKSLNEGLKHYHDRSA